MDEQLKKILRGMVEYNGIINDMLKGKTVEIISDFNDQPIGRSKPSLKGKRYKIRHASADHMIMEGEIHLWCVGLQCLPKLWKDAVLVADSASGDGNG